MDGAVNEHYKEVAGNTLTSKDKELLNKTNSPAKDSDLQAEKYGGDTPSQQGSGTATVLDNASGQSNPNVIYWVNSVFLYSLDFFFVKYTTSLPYENHLTVRIMSV